MKDVLNKLIFTLCYNVIICIKKVNFCLIKQEFSALPTKSNGYFHGTYRFIIKFLEEWRDKNIQDILEQGIKRLL